MGTCTGHSCSDNNIYGLIPLFFKMVASMSTTQRLVHTVCGKQVYLIKMTDKLTTRVDGLSETLRTVDKTFRAWQSEFFKLSQKQKSVTTTLHWNFYLNIPWKLVAP